MLTWIACRPSRRYLQSPHRRAKVGTYPLPAACAAATFPMILRLTARCACFSWQSSHRISPSAGKFLCSVVLFSTRASKLPIAFVIRRKKIPSPRTSVYSKCPWQCKDMAGAGKRGCSLPRKKGRKSSAPPPCRVGTKWHLPE